MNGGRRNAVLVGAFVIAMLAALVGSLVWLKGWTRDTTSYVTVFRSVSGLTVGAQVLYEGYQVGRVTGIDRLTGSETATLFGDSGEAGPLRFRVDMAVKEGWPVAAGAEAGIVATGLLTAVSIDIVERRTGGAEAARRALDGVPVIAGRDSEGLWQKAETIIDTVTPLAEVVDEIVRGSLKPTFDQLRDLSVYLQATLPPLVERIDGFTAALAAAGDDVQQLTGAENRRHIEATLANLHETSAGLTRLTARLDGLAASLDALVSANRADVDQSVDSLRYAADAIARDVDAITRNAEATARNMNEFSRQIRQNPSRLLGGALSPGGR